LGTKSLKALTLASSTGTLLATDAKGYGFEPKGLWLHSLSCGFAARAVSIQLGDNEEAAADLFLVGLLHDLGKVVLADLIRQPANGETILPKDEVATLGFDHGAVTGMITEKWGLPHEITATIRDHHQARSEKTSRASAILQLADGLVKEVGLGLLEAQDPPDSLDPMFCDILETDENDLQRILDGVREEVSDEREALMSMGGSS